MKDFKLCYIDRDTAYFTTQDLDEQWGDDWDDIPYEHNAGTPYEPHENIPDNWNEDGSPKWEIYTLKFDPHNMETPCFLHSNSPYSVDKINAGAVAWLFGWDNNTRKHVVINAGASIDEFKQKVRQCGGKIYILEE